MARTLTEIQNSIKAEFVNHPTLKEAYGLDTGSFDDQFSKVSIEAILIYIIASVLWVHENLWDRFSAEIEEKVNQSQVMTTAWYHHMALKFQYGDTLEFNPKRFTYEYKTEKPDKQIIKYAAIREVIEANKTVLKIFVSGAGKTFLEPKELAAFKEYIQNVGAAGIHYSIISKTPNKISLSLNIYYDPMILKVNDKDELESINETGLLPVQKTIENYLDGIEYGGEFYATKLVDALQNTEGIKDVVLNGVKESDTTEYVYKRKILSENGSFVYLHDPENVKYHADTSKNNPS